MNESDIMRLFAQATKKCGYHDYAKQLENAATIYEANEIVREYEKKEGGERNAGTTNIS